MANSVDTLALSPKAHGHMYAHDVYCTCIFTVVKLWNPVPDCGGQCMWQGKCGDWRWTLRGPMVREAFNKRNHFIIDIRQ